MDNQEVISKLEGTLAYVSLMTPVQCWEETKGKEWKVTIIVDKKTAKAWNKIYKKQQAKEIDNEIFADQFKIDPPYPEQDEQYAITLRKNTMLGNGQPVPDKYKPCLWEKVGRNAIDVTNRKEVSNGSKGQVTVDNWVDKKGNAFAKLGNVLVTELIEYVRENKNPLAAFGVELEVSDDDSSNTKQATAQVVSKPTQKASAPKKVQEQDFDDDIPF
jgi:hypothetical protein